MLNIKKKYVVDENNNKLAVEIDLKTFEKIEQIMEDYALGKLMLDTKNEDNLSMEKAKKYYTELAK